MPHGIVHGQELPRFKIELPEHVRGQRIGADFHILLWKREVGPHRQGDTPRAETPLGRRHRAQLVDE